MTVIAAVKSTTETNEKIITFFEKRSMPSSSRTDPLPLDFPQVTYIHRRRDGFPNPYDDAVALSFDHVIGVVIHYKGLVAAVKLCAFEVPGSSCVYNTHFVARLDIVGGRIVLPLGQWDVAKVKVGIRGYSRNLAEAKLPE